MRRGDHLVNKSIKRKSDNEEKARAWVLALIFTLVSFSFFFIMMMMWYLIYYHSLEVTALVLLLLLVVASIMIVVGGRDLREHLSTYRSAALKKNRKWLMWLGLLCLFATVVGTIIGFFAYFQKLVFYNSYMEMRTYTNVGASQSKSMISDGAVFLFSEDTRLDTTRSVGYQSKWTGKTYCVAPIVDSGMGSGDDINFWAVGRGCCASRAQFYCDDAQDFSVSSGLVAMKAEDIVRPTMRWAVASVSDPIDQYKEAISLQEAVYFTHAAEDPVFVRWVRDPLTEKNKYLRDARLILGISSVIVFILCAVASYWIMFHMLYPIKSLKGMPLR